MSYFVFIAQLSYFCEQNIISSFIISDTEVIIRIGSSGEYSK